MNQAQRERLSAAGIDVDQALERMMGSQALLERLLQKFLEDQNFALLTKALEERNLDGAIAAAHSLKGVCGNLSMAVLFPLFTRRVEALRQGDWGQAEALMEDIRPAYAMVVQGIRGIADDRCS